MGVASKKLTDMWKKGKRNNVVESTLGSRVKTAENLVTGLCVSRIERGGGKTRGYECNA